MQALARAVLVSALILLVQSSCFLLVSSTNYADEAPVDIIGVSSSSTSTFLSVVAEYYRILRPDVHIVENEALSTSTTTSTQMGKSMIDQGQGDFGLVSYTLTASDAITSPDLLVFPFWAAPFSPIYNLPGIANLVLSKATVCKIWRGNITRWNDPALASINPSVTLPAMPIEVALNSDPFTLVKEFTRSCAAYDAQFNKLIGFTSYPVWPKTLYAKYAMVQGVDGPGTYITQNPYSIALSMTINAQKLSAVSASMINPAGRTVAPTFAAISAAFAEMTLTSTQLPDGQVVKKFNGVVMNAPGPSSWPMLISSSLLLPKSFVRTTCRAKSEMVKFLKWMLNSDAVRNVVGAQELISLIDVTNDQLGLVASMDALNCDEIEINSDEFQPLTIAGIDISTQHVSLQRMLLEHYNEKLTDGRFDFYDTNEQNARLLALNPATSNNVAAAWTFNFVYERLWDEPLVRPDLLLVPSGLQAILIQYNLPDAVSARLTAANAFPLVLDMETLGSVFAGEIQSWTDPALVALNPALAAAFTGTGESTAITLVLCADPDGSPSHTEHETAMSNHLAIMLERTRAFSSISPRWNVPVDFSPIVNRIQNAGNKVTIVEQEAQLETAIARTSGGVGYMLAFGTTVDPTTVFSIKRSISPSVWVSTTTTTLAGSTTTTALTDSSVVSADVANIANCGSAAMTRVATTAALNPQLTAADSFTTFTDQLLDVNFGTNPDSMGCYPLSLPLSLQLPKDLWLNRPPSVAGSLASVELACGNAQKMASFAAWMLQDDSTEVASERAGFASAVGFDNAAALMDQALKELNCNGTPLLWTPPIIWKFSNSLYTFSMVVADIGIFFILVTIAVLVKFRKRSFVSACNIPLQLTTLFGIGNIFASVVLYAQPATNSLCSAVSWTLFFGITCTFTPAAMKVWKLYYNYAQTNKWKERIKARKHKELQQADETHTISRRGLFKAASSRASPYVRAPRQVTETMMSFMVLSLIIVELILLSISQGMKQGVLFATTTTQLENNVPHSYTQCLPTSQTIGPAGLLLAFNGLIVLIGAYSAFSIRHLSSAYNESKHLSWALFNATFSSCLFSPIIVLTGNGIGDVGVFLQLLLLLWLGICTLLFVFGARAWLVISERLRQAAMVESMTGSVTTGRSLTSHRSLTGNSTGATSDLQTLQDIASVLDRAEAEIETMSLLQLTRFITALDTHIEELRLRRVRLLGQPTEAEIVGVPPVSRHKPQPSNSLSETVQSSPPAGPSASPSFLPLNKMSPITLASSTPQSPQVVAISPNATTALIQVTQGPHGPVGTRTTSSGTPGGERSRYSTRHPLRLRSAYAPIQANESPRRMRG